MMGRMRDTDLMGGLAKRLDGPASTETASQSQAVEPVMPAPTTNRKRVRDELKFVGFHTTEDQKEKLRVLSFETRKQNQELMREALDLLFKKYSVS